MVYRDIGNELRQEKELWIAFENHFYLWGAAGKGTTFIRRYHNKISIKAVVDIDSNKQGQQLLEVPIISPEELNVSDGKIIICTEAYQEVSKYLKELGLRENIDYIDYKRFATIYDWYVEGKVYINRVDISVTNRCTLNCEGCNMLMSYYCNPQDRKLDEIKRDLDAFFEWVDTVEDMNLLGGEPLLYPELVEVLQYIQNNYRDKIVDIYMFTNGMCNLSEELLDISQKMDVIYDVSDYTYGLPQLEPRLEKFQETLSQHQISYVRKKMDFWLDFGFEAADHSGESEEQKIAFFHRCGAPFRGLRDRKFYFCHLEASAIELGEWKEQEGDTFLLEPYDANKRIELLEFNLGYSKRGYPSICMRCKGCCSETKIGVAVQRKRNGR